MIKQTINRLISATIKILCLSFKALPKRNVIRFRLKPPNSECKGVLFFKTKKECFRAFLLYIN